MRKTRRSVRCSVVRPQFCCCNTSLVTLHSSLIGGSKRFKSIERTVAHPTWEKHQHTVERKDVSHEDVILQFEQKGLLQDARLAQVCREFRPEQFKPANIWLNPIPGTVPPEEILLQVLTATYSYLAALQVLSSRLQPGSQVLAVAVADGLEIACMAKLVAPYGHVFGITHEENTTDFAKAKKTLNSPEISRLIPPRAYSFTSVTNPLDGLPEQAPFDAIYVSKAVKAVSPKWVSQLKPGGLMSVPLLTEEGNNKQKLMLVEKGFDGSDERIFLDEVPVSFEVLWV